MNGLERTRAACPLLLALLCLTTAAHAQAQPQASQAPTSALESAFLSSEPAAAAKGQQDDPVVERIEALRTEIIENRDDVLAVEAQAREARGADLVALRTKASEMRLDSMATLRKLVDAVHELEAGSGDASLYRSQLAELLPALMPLLASHLDAAEDSLAKIKEERDAAAPENRIAIEQLLTHQNALVGRLLGVGVDLVDMIEGLAIDAPQTREIVSARLADRAVVISGRIELLAATLADAEAREAAAPDDATVRAEILALRTRFGADTDELASQLPLMDQLGLETADYKQLLISATGEITADVFDTEIAQGLLARWADGVREGLVQNGPGFLFKALLFLLVLSAFWLLSRFVRKITERAVEARHLRFSQLLKRMIVSGASGAVLVLGLLVAVSQLGIRVGPLLAGLGIAGFIVGFALQETLANFAAGMMILAYRPFDVGDLIECAGGVFGTVSHMNLVSTTILTIDNRTKIVPNGKIWGDVITNLTAQTKRRVDLVFGISYTDDIPRAEAILSSVVKEHPKVLADPEPLVKLHELGDSSVNFVVRPWCASGDYWDVHWDITREVKLRFDREGVSIPFPQRDVHFYPAQTNGGAPAGAAPPPSRLETESTPLSGQSEPDDEA
jgi:small conductance mechanosensitive channel